MTSVFIRDDGRPIRVVSGFRDQVLSARRAAVRPTLEWSEEDYAAAAAEKIERVQRLLSAFAVRGGAIRGARVLEVGCGPGIDTILLGLQPVGEVIGIDVTLPLFDADGQGRRARHLARHVLDQLAITTSVDRLATELPISFARVGVTALPYDAARFDFVVSEAVLEHVQPLGPALAEMGRVMAPGALARHKIDPFYWLRGCHRRGLIDIPWAHARLTLDELHRAAVQLRGRRKGEACRSWLESLNRYSLAGWRDEMNQASLEIITWKERRSPLAAALLEQHPEVEDTRLPALDRRDLDHGSITAWLRA